MSEMSTRETVVAVLGLLGGFVKWVGVCVLVMAAIWLAYSAVAFIPLLIIAAVLAALVTGRSR